jgi:hypothetical protein
VRREGQKGQAIIELALLFPILLLVFMGAWTGAALIANNDTAAQVSGYGARIAAEIGNGCSLVAGTVTCTQAASPTCQSTATDPCAVDQAIIAAMTPALNSQLSNSQVKEIDIYQPGDCTANSNNWSSGVCPTSDGSVAGALLLRLPVDTYQYCSSTSQWVLTDGTSPTGTCAKLGPLGVSASVGGVAPYTLGQRTQTVTDEQAIGVSLTFQFTSPVLNVFSQTDTVYTAITFPPQGS